MAKWVKQIERILGKKQQTEPVDIINDPRFMHFYEKCKPYTMTSAERMYSLYQTANYILRNNIPGDFVECGVWKGGSSMMMAYVLKAAGVTDRKIYLYDTFEGMNEPTELDKSFQGDSAKSQLENQDRQKADSVWCYSSLDEVKNNLRSTGIDEDILVYIKGPVEITLREGGIPDSISLLRLDTDWYESTKVELEVLYPQVAKNGAVIIDDFGHWEGAKKAVTEFLDGLPFIPLIHRIDYTGRIFVK